MEIILILGLVIAVSVSIIVACLRAEKRAKVEQARATRTAPSTLSARPVTGSAKPQQDDGSDLLMTYLVADAVLGDDEPVREEPRRSYVDTPSTTTYDDSHSRSTSWGGDSSSSSSSSWDSGSSDSDSSSSSWD